MHAIHVADPPYTPEQAESLGFWARLTAKPAATSTGSGKVFVIAEDDYTADPADGDYQAVSSSGDGYSDVYFDASLLNSNVPFKIFAKANAGSYFTGWSFTEGYTDLQVNNDKLEVEPSSVKSHANVREHIVYAAFEPIQLVSYTVSGNNTTAGMTCTQTVTFRAASPGGNALGSSEGVRHFKLPTVTAKAGTTGTWTTGVTEWESGVNVQMYGEIAVLTVPVTFTAPNGDVAEYGATLTLETYAGVKTIVHLSARTTGGEYEAIRYNASKVLQETGDLVDLLDNAEDGDIVKLNADYDDDVEIDKSITFDLNGYTISEDYTLTVSDGDVTLAYSPYGGLVAGGVEVSDGKLTLNGGTINGDVIVSKNAELVQNGAIIRGVLNNKGTTTTTAGQCMGGVTSKGVLTLNGGKFFDDALKYDSEEEGASVEIKGGTAYVNRGTFGFDGEYTNPYGLLVTAGIVTIGKNAEIYGRNTALQREGGTMTVNGGKFNKPSMLATGDITFVSGYFKDNEGNTSVLGKPVWRNTAGPEYREGYEFFAGDQATAQACNVSVCRIGPVSYATLEEALAYANNSGKEVIIIMENDYTLAAGYYTLPANATLVVPMSDDQNGPNLIVPREDGLEPAVSFRKLIFESGVHMTVLGTIEVTGTQYGSGTTMGVPGGNYGHLILKPGSHMTINNGGELRAWGYVTGDGTKDGDGNYLSGEIDARRGAIVREMFQMGDWKGGDISLTLVMPTEPYLTYQDKTHLFPIYSYFIQNVESPVKYHPGSALLCAASVNVANVSAYANSIKVVGKQGEAAMFLMDEMADADNTWVRKYYDAKNDKQVYEVNSGAQLGSVVIDLGEVPGAMFDGEGTYKIQLDSRKFILPLTSNFKIHLLSGTMQFTQSTSCLPGMEVEIDKESEISIIKNDDASIVSGALYLYDADQWSYKNKGYVGNSGHFGEIVQYSATWDLDPSKPSRPNVRNVSSPAAIGDAKLNVHGTFRMSEDCAVYTSWAKDDTKLAINAEGTGGAQIVSTNADAGTFIFDDPAPAFSGITFSAGHEGEFNLDYMTIGQNCLFNYDHNNHGEDANLYPIKETPVRGSEDVRLYGWELFTSAKLMNSDGSFVSTEGTLANKSYCFINDEWTSLTVDGCFMVDAQDVYYAKPQDYVALASTTPNADHTYSDKAGTGRLFILLTDEDGNCTEWWEVEKEDNLYHCIHPDNDTYYYWDETRIIVGELNPGWVEKRYTITWKNWDGTVIQTADRYGDMQDSYSVTYGTQAEFLGNNPTRPADIDYTYDFSGWSPALGPVTSDVTYTATYEKQQRKYTVIFTEEGGAEIERQFLAHNAIPACENVPTRTGFTLQWDPAIAAVTGDATYRATWLPEPPTEYEVTFFDYDGTTVIKQSNVAVGDMPTSPVIMDGVPSGSSGKPATSEFTYVFDHWSPSLETVSATSIKSYTAVYSEVPKTYTISYYKENGTTLISSEELAWGATPTPPAVTKENPVDGHTYTLVWKTLDESSTIQTVMGAVSYKPTYIDVVNKYTVTLRSSIPGQCSLTGAGIYDYGTDLTIAATPAEGYEFVRWDETSSTASSFEHTVNADVTFTAVVQVYEPPTPAADLEIAADGDVTLDADITYDNLVITSNGLTSGQLKGSEHLTLTGDAFFDLNINAMANTWYAVAVPWPVEVDGGILVNDVPLAINSDFRLLTYDSEGRAAHGKTGSNWLYAAGSDIMQPGTLYMISLNNPASTIRFRKKDGSNILTTSLNVEAHASAHTQDAGWNGIANPALYYAYLNASAVTYELPNFGQKYLPLESSYDAVNMKLAPMIVGEPIFVQVPADKVVPAEETSGSFSAPARDRKVDNAYYEVHLSADNVRSDRIYLMSWEGKEDRYEIGLDLAKAGTSTKVAQMWVDRYDTKLCVNTTAPDGITASYPLGISVPKDGEYQLISATSMQEGQELYVTRNDRVIWNLARAPYTLTLTAGTHTEYGLRLIQGAPQSTTDIEQTEAESTAVQKLFIGNQVYILRQGELYTLTGQKIR